MNFLLNKMLWNADVYWLVSIFSAGQGLYMENRALKR